MGILLFRIAVLLSTVITADSTGVCTYDIVLNHGQSKGKDPQCKFSEDKSCCQALKAEITSLRKWADQLRRNTEDDTEDITDITHITDITAQTNLSLIASLMKSPNLTDNEKKLLQTIAQKDAEIQATKLISDSVETQIQTAADKSIETEQDFNRTQAILKQVKEHSSEQLDKLAKEIANITRHANTCKGKLGLTWGKRPFSEVYSDAVFHWYCSFEHGACGVTRGGIRTDESWVVGSLGIDHTYGSHRGHVIFLKKSIRNGTLAKFQTHSFEPQPNYCLRFWYNMYQVDGKQLIVKILGDRSNPVWSTYGVDGQAWHLGEVDLDSEHANQHTFYVMFDAVHNDTNHHIPLANITVDDIHLYNVTCNSIPSCPIGSVIRKQNGSSSCYTFHTTPANWYQSQQVCHEEGATSHLVSINTRDEQEYIVNEIKSDPGLREAGKFGWFTSGNDFGSEGHFDWTDTGTPYQSLYSDWHQGQPNNVGGDQDCLLLQYAGDDYEWGDVNCDEQHPYICEVNLPTP